jgi:hypothetical protein
MALSRAQKKNALAWFKAKNGDQGCPVCGESSWKVETDATLGGLGAGAIHVVTIICLNCEHILLFNVGIALYKPEE